MLGAEEFSIIMMGQCLLTRLSVVFDETALTAETRQGPVLGRAGMLLTRTFSSGSSTAHAVMYSLTPQACRWPHRRIISQLLWYRDQQGARFFAGQPLRYQVSTGNACYNGLRREK